jgi:aspartate carbamoyltransferase catalytic subunit
MLVDRSTESVTTPTLGRRVTDSRPLAADVSPVLERLAGKSLISVLDVSRDEVLGLLSLAARVQADAGRPATALSGKIVLTAFFEPSTRTRLSFESAAHRLGAAVMSIPDARFTSVHKGESITDTGMMLNSYADVIVLRHTAENSVDDIRASGMTVPLINGGNGCDEHPTQAMADWYALLKWRPELSSLVPAQDSRISLCMLGTPRRMRSMRSFLLMAATHFPQAVRDITVVSDDPQPLDADLTAVLAYNGIEHRCDTDFEPHASKFDVVYQNSLTLVDQEYQVLGSKIRLDAATPLKPDAVVMHPLARQDELSTDLDDTPRNLYFDQAAGAVFVRQALLLAITGRLGTLARNEG